MCDDLDDAVQEVFIKVFRAKLPPEERFLGWFYTVILNTGRDLGRRRKTRQGLLQKLAEATPDPLTAREPGRAPRDPALTRALVELPHEFREAVALRFYADLSLAEIARCQGVPVGTVKSRLHSAMSRLRSALKENEATVG
jgi:RNA polymerase sigma-70 factor (ECF subfamily)